MAKHSPEHDRKGSHGGSGRGSSQQSGGQQEKHRQQEQQSPDRDRSSRVHGSDMERKRSGSDDMSDRGQQHSKDDVERE